MHARILIIKCVTIFGILHKHKKNDHCKIIIIKTPAFGMKETDFCQKLQSFLLFYSMVSRQNISGTLRLT